MVPAQNHRRPARGDSTAGGERSHVEPAPGETSGWFHSAGSTDQEKPSCFCRSVFHLQPSRNFTGLSLCNYRRILVWLYIKNSSLQRNSKIRDIFFQVLHWNLNAPAAYYKMLLQGTVELSDLILLLLELFSFLYKSQHFASIPFFFTEMLLGKF